MLGIKPTVITPEQQREFISKHLRHADQLLRSNNFEGALLEVTKALSIDPKHSLARSFQQRILLMQKQTHPGDHLKHKGPSPEEIKLMISQLFATAEQLMAQKKYQEALKKIAEVYVVDPVNHFAKAYSDRLEQLIMQQEQEKPKHAADGTEQDKPEASVSYEAKVERGSVQMYEEMMKEAWFDGKVTPEEEEELRGVREVFHISIEEHTAMEKKVKIESYVEALRLAWKDGVISEMERQVLDMMRRRYGITPNEHVTIEHVIQEAKKGTRAKARILVVESDKTILMNITRAFQQHNYEVVAANRVEDALQIMTTQLPQLIISEALFPSGTLDGFEFYKKIQKHPMLHKSPFFFIVDANSQKISRAALRMGFDLCITKPLDVELLLAAVDGRLKPK